MFADFRSIPVFREMAIDFGPEHVIGADLALDDGPAVSVHLPVADNDVLLELGLGELLLAVVAAHLLLEHGEAGVGTEAARLGQGVLEGEAAGV
jgi:hypothetical protein